MCYINQYGQTSNPQEGRHPAAVAEGRREEGRIWCRGDGDFFSQPGATPANCGNFGGKLVPAQVRKGSSLVVSKTFPQRDVVHLSPWEMAAEEEEFEDGSETLWEPEEEEDPEPHGGNRRRHRRSHHQRHSSSSSSSSSSSKAQAQEEEKGLSQASKSRRSVSFRMKEKEILDEVLGQGRYDKRIRPAGVNSTGGLSAGGTLTSELCQTPWGKKLHRVFYKICYCGRNNGESPSPSPPPSTCHFCHHTCICRPQ